MSNSVVDVDINLKEIRISQPLFYMQFVDDD